MIAYPWIPGVGFGVKYAGTLTPPTGGFGTDATPSGNAVATAGTNAASPSPATAIAVAAAWTPGVGFGAGYSGAIIPTLTSTNSGRGLGFSPSGAAVAIGVGNTFSPGNPGALVAFPWSTGGGFGSKYSNPATLAIASSVYVLFSRTGAAVVQQCNAGVGLRWANPYPWSDGGGFGAMLSAPGTGNPVGGGLAFSPDNAYVALGNSIGNRIHVYPWSDGGGFGAEVTAPGTLPSGTLEGVAWAEDGLSIVCGTTLSPFLAGYPWSSGAFGAKYADPAVTSGNTGRGLIFLTGSEAPPSPGQPDDCGPKNLTPKPLSLIEPEPVVKTYPHVTEITDWPAQQSIKLLWDKLHDHESRLRAGVANDQQWVTAANASADAVKAAQLTADHALAQAGAGVAASDVGTGGGGESGGDGGSPDDPEAGDGFNNRFATGHPPALPVPLTSYTAGQIVGGVANEFPALFANYPSDAETVAACQEYVLRTIWHLQQAGFVAGRQRNPSLLISNDKITIFIDGTYRAYDIASLGGAGSPNVPHIIRVSPADYVADAGTPD